MDQSIKPISPLNTVRLIGAGQITVSGEEARRIMIQAVGEAGNRLAHRACAGCEYRVQETQFHPYGEGFAAEALESCEFSEVNPMHCPAVKMEFDIGVEEAADEVMA